MFEALPEPYPPVPEPWSSWRRDQLLEKINALMIDAGFFRSVPSAVRGTSGVSHQFTLMYFDSDSHVVVDVYDRASAVEVIQTYAKALDTSSRARVVSVEEPTAFAVELAKKYGLALDTASDVQEMYSKTLGKSSTAS